MFDSTTKAQRIPLPSDNPPFSLSNDTFSLYRGDITCVRLGRKNEARTKQQTKLEANSADNPKHSCSNMQSAVWAAPVKSTERKMPDIYFFDLHSK